MNSKKKWKDQRRRKNKRKKSESENRKEKKKRAKVVPFRELLPTCLAIASPRVIELHVFSISKKSRKLAKLVKESVSLHTALLKTKNIFFCRAVDVRYFLYLTNLCPGNSGKFPELVRLLC